MRKRKRPEKEKEANESDILPLTGTPTQFTSVWNNYVSPSVKVELIIHLIIEYLGREIEWYAQTIHKKTSNSVSWNNLTLIDLTPIAGTYKGMTISSPVWLETTKLDTSVPRGESDEEEKRYETHYLSKIKMCSSAVPQHLFNHQTEFEHSNSGLEEILDGFYPWRDHCIVPPSRYTPVTYSKRIRDRTGQHLVLLDTGTITRFDGLTGKSVTFAVPSDTSILSIALDYASNGCYYVDVKGTLSFVNMTTWDVQRLRTSDPMSGFHYSDRMHWLSSTGWLMISTGCQETGEGFLEVIDRFLPSSSMVRYRWPIIELVGLDPDKFSIRWYEFKVDEKRQTLFFMCRVLDRSNKTDETRIGSCRLPSVLFASSSF
jgi:hypothetical protein